MEDIFRHTNGQGSFDPMRSFLAALGDKDTTTALLKAIKRAQGDVNFTDRYGWTFLMYLVCYAGRCKSKKRPTFIEAMHLFLNHGANANIADAYGNTAFRLAIDTGQRDIIELLFTHGADFLPESINMPKAIRLFVAPTKTKTRPNALGRGGLFLTMLLFDQEALPQDMAKAGLDINVMRTIHERRRAIRCSFERGDHMEHNFEGALPNDLQGDNLQCASDLYNRPKPQSHGIKLEVYGWVREDVCDLVWQLDRLIAHLRLKGAWVEIKGKWVSLLAPRPVPKPITDKARTIYEDIVKRM